MLKEYPPEVIETLKLSGEVSYIGKKLDDRSIKKDRARSDLNVCKGHFECVKDGIYDNSDELTDETKEALKEFADITLEEIEGIIFKYFGSVQNIV